MQEKSTVEGRARKTQAGESKSRASERRKKSENSIFADDTQSAPDLSKRTGSGQLSGEAAARLFGQNQDRARGRGKQRNLPFGEDIAATSVYGSRTKVSAYKITNRWKRGAE